MVFTHNLSNNSNNFNNYYGNSNSNNFYNNNIINNHNTIKQDINKLILIIHINMIIIININNIGNKIIHNMGIIEDIIIIKIIIKIIISNSKIMGNKDIILISLLLALGQAILKLAMRNSLEIKHNHRSLFLNMRKLLKKWNQKHLHSLFLQFKRRKNLSQRKRSYLFKKSAS